MAKQLSQRLGEQPLGSYKAKAAETEISQKPAGCAWIPIFGNQKKLFWLILPSAKGSSQRPLGLEVHGAKPLCAYSQGLVPSFCLLPGAKTLSASLFSVGKITTICAQFLLSLDNRQGKVKRSMDSNLCSQEKQRNCYFLFLDFRGNKIGSSCCTFLEYLKTHILKKKQMGALGMSPLHLSAGNEVHSSSLSCAVSLPCDSLFQ